VIIVDSGVLIAAADKDDRHHNLCLHLFREHASDFVVPAGVVVAVCWMLGRHVSIDLEADFLASIADGELHVEAHTPADYQRAAQLVTTYRSLPLDAVDAMVIASAERLRVTTVATIDHRHFSVVRPDHAPHFELLPDLS
jgi:predicted nucleic acid-binding protein